MVEPTQNSRSQQSPGGCTFFQVGYVTADIDRAIAHFSSTCGATLKDVVRDMCDSSGIPVMIENLSHMRLGKIEIELIQPRRNWPSIYADCDMSIDRIATLHHMGFLAHGDEQWDSALNQAIGAAVPVAWTVELPQVRFAYLDMRAKLGHYVEIVQRL